MKSAGIGFIAAILIVMGAQLALAQNGDANAGKAIFAKSCSICHGKDGNTPNAAVGKMLKAEIPQLGSSEIQAKSDDDIKKIITEGYIKMKPIKGLTDKDVNNVIAFVRTLKKP
jgi:mono/diheme cytochrome c family protein